MNRQAYEYTTILLVVKIISRKKISDPPCHLWTCWLLFQILPFHPISPALWILHTDLLFWKLWKCHSLSFKKSLDLLLILLTSYLSSLRSSVGCLLLCLFLDLFLLIPENLCPLSSFLSSLGFLSLGFDDDRDWSPESLFLRWGCCF